MDDSPGRYWCKLGRAVQRNREARRVELLPCSLTLAGYELDECRT